MNVIRSFDDGRLLGDADYFYHGTTVTTNAMITGGGAKVGFITTAGHRDALSMMRIIGRSAGKSEAELKQYSYTGKPQPIVPKALIREVHERVDRCGTVVVPFDEVGARKAVCELAEAGVEAIAVCFLWSFMNRDHEQRMKQIVLEEAPEVHVAISCEIMPAIKEYERSATTVVTAYLAPLLTAYLNDLASELTTDGLAGPLFVMQSLGGAMGVSQAGRRAANTLASGPAGGVVAATFVGGLIAEKNIICADVGGTSFDVGLIVDGDPLITSQSIVNQYTLLVPALDIVSIGAGGGSVASVDLGRLNVGPTSAGAAPGPACYGRGGTEPTTTDADVVLGYIDPDYFLGGAMSLDKDLAEKAIHDKIAAPLGISTQAAAAGIVEIANHHMSDLMRKMTIERGHDPRDFVVFAFGGAGPLHGGALGRELGAKEIIFPLGNVASAFSALGLSVSDLTTVTQTTRLALAPLSAEVVSRTFQDLEAEALNNLQGAGVQPGDIQLNRVLELRYKGQVHQVDTPLPPDDLNDDILRGALVDFERRYEALFGPGSSYSDAGIELVAYRVVGTATVERSTLQEADLGPPDAGSALLGKESLYWRELGGETETAIYGELHPGMQLDGPAVLRMPSTTGLVHPGQSVRVDAFANIRIRSKE